LLTRARPKQATGGWISTENRELQADIEFLRLPMSRRVLSSTNPQTIPSDLFLQFGLFRFCRPEGVYFSISFVCWTELFETGLLVCPPEKKAAKLASSNEQDSFSGPV
jgi:hypothetical protein